MNMTKKHLAWMFAAAALVLGGCGVQNEEPWTAERTAVEIQTDGTITETIIDSLDQGWYDASELQSMITESVADYNQSAGGQSITTETVNMDETGVQVVMTYQSSEDFSLYNRVQFFSGSMLSAQMEGFLFDTQFYSVNKGEMSSSLQDNQDPLSHKEYQVLICSGTHQLHVPGPITYVSENAVVTDTYTAQIGNAENAAELVYVIYEY